MHLPDLTFHDPASIAEATALMSQYAPDARYLAGGTDLLVDLKTRRLTVGHVIALSRLSELRDIAFDGQQLRIGALITVNDLADSAEVRRTYPALLDVTSELAAEQIRNMATVGGNVTSAVPSADMPPILLVLGATLRLRSAESERNVPIGEFFLGPRQSAIRPDELLEAILIPLPPEHFGAAYARFAHRKANSCAVAGVAAGVQLAGDTITEATIAMSAVAPTPLQVPDAAALLLGKAPEPDVFAEAAKRASEAAVPISDVRGTAEFRRQIVDVLTQRALAKACERARGGS